MHPSISNPPFIVTSTTPSMSALPSRFNGHCALGGHPKHSVEWLPHISLVITPSQVTLPETIPPSIVIQPSMSTPPKVTKHPQWLPHPCWSSHPLRDHSTLNCHPAFNVHPTYSHETPSAATPPSLVITPSQRPFHPQLSSSLQCPPHLQSRNTLSGYPTLRDHRPS